ncbi:hypothetical protein M3612_25250 [Niallia taxi]|uniref:hypothetical protein n=1 Tax=Niallia taxi TaxID=2499688 RepID=UPI002040B621|nr:hypothetical protein [Niallia taxi]MCM3217781.1 hypothetical protein [Niallia taxi]
MTWTMTLQLKDYSEKSIARHAIPNLKINHRKIGYKYDSKSVKEFKPVEADLTIQESNSLEKVFRYVHIGSMLAMLQFGNVEQKQNFFGNLYKNVPNFLEEETKFANQEDNLCFFSSSLMYLLLREEPTIDNKKLKYVQGFIKTKTSDRYIHPDGKQTPFMFNSHAFVVYRGMVIDTTIMQVEKYLDYQLEKPFVYGSNGYLFKVFTHFGWEEYPQTAAKFAKRYALMSNNELNDWLKKHQNHCANF